MRHEVRQPFEVPAERAGEIMARTEAALGLMECAIGQLEYTDERIRLDVVHGFLLELPSFFDALATRPPALERRALRLLVRVAAVLTLYDPQVGRRDLLGVCHG